MGTIQFLGLQSGIDANSIIDQLVALRRKPIQMMAQARDNLLYQRSVVQSVNTQLLRLNSAMLDLTLEATFRTRKVTSSAENLVSATAAIGAPVGSYSVSVSQLARASRAVSGLDGALATRRIFLAPANTAGIAGIAVTGSLQTVGASSGSLLKNTVQAGTGTAAPTAGDSITISGNLKDGTPVSGTFTFAGDSTDTLQRLAQTIVQTFQGEVMASIGRRGEIILTETDPTVAGDITFNTTVAPYGIQFHDNDYSGSTFTLSAGNSRAGGGAVARQLTNTTCYTVAGTPAVGTDDLANLDQMTGTLDSGDVIRVTGVNPDGSLINGGTGTYDFTYGVTGTTLSQFITAVSGVYTGAALTLDSGRLVLTDSAGGVSQSSITLSFVDGGPSTTAFAAGSFIITREGANQTAQVITTGPFTLEAVGTHFISGSQGMAGRIWGSTTIFDPSNTLGSYGVTVFNQFAVDPDDSGPQGFTLIQGLSADASIQDLVEAINSQVPTVTAQLVESGGSFRLEIQANGGGRDIRLIDGLGGILDTLVKIGATDLASSTNDGLNMFGATTATAHFAMVATQRTADGASIRTAATGADGANVTRIIKGATISGAAYGEGTAVAVSGLHDTLNTTPALRTYILGASNIAATPPATSPFINIYAPLASAGFAITPQNASDNPGYHTDGTLLINGVPITIGDVNTTTMAGIMAQINGSGAGVTLRYDEGMNRFLLESNEFGNQSITLGGPGNTSNLFTILGLAANAGGQTVAGRADGTISTTAPLAEASFTITPTSGVFTINGVAINVDAGVDTLNNIIDRINLSQAGVIASYDVGTDRLVLMQDLTKNPTAAQIAVGAATDTSNFLVATRFLSSLGTTQAVGTQRQDAVFAVDGVQYVRASNSPSDVIQGLTLALKGITTAPATVDVTTDTDRILNAITSFVVEYNTTIDLVNQQPLTAAERAYLEPLTDDDLAELTLEEIDEYNTRRNELRQRDFISRDSAMLAIARSLRQLVSGSVNNTGTFKSLAQVGLITASVGSSAEDARLNRGLLLSQTTDRELLEPLITGNVTLLAAVYGNPDALFDLFATTVESRLTLTGTRNLAGGISVSSNLRFTIGDGSGALATVSFAPGSYSATAVLNTVSSALIAAGLGETILPYYDSGYRLNLTSTRSDRRAEISLTDQSSGGDSLLATLGLNTGTNLGVDPYEYAGVARRTRSFISSQTGISGIIRERIRSGGTYDRQVENYESVIAQAEERLEAYEARLRNQFVHLETYLAEISDVSQYVEAYLAAQIAAASQYNQYA